MQKNKWKNQRISGARGFEVKLKNEIGSGAFSFVYSTSDNDTVAKLMNLQHDGSRQSFENESKFFEKIGPHANIIRYMGSREMEFPSNPMGVILIENCPKGSIDEIMLLSARNQLSQTQIIRVILQAARGLSHMHQHGVIHRDVKIQNILLGEDGEYKLCDFGSATTQYLQRISDHKDMEQLISEINTNTTPMYRAPEMLDPFFFKDSPLADKVDIFALGVVAYVLCYKKPPFESALGTITGCCIWPDLPPVSDEFQKLMERMLAVDPSQRPSANEVAKYILTDIKFDVLTQGFIEPTVFSSKSLNKEAKESWLSIIQTKFLGAFFDTRGWIKGALSYNEYGPSQREVINLLSKAWKKPIEKTIKFYRLLDAHMSQNKENTIISLKALVLLHSYMKKGPVDIFGATHSKKPNIHSIISDILSTWSLIEELRETRKIDPKRSSFSSQLIINLSRLLLQKIKLHQTYVHYIHGNFSLQPFFDSLRNPSPTQNSHSLNPQLLLDLLDYYQSILMFVNQNLLAVGHLWNLQVCIALSMADEIYCVVCLLLHLYKTLKLSTNFNPDRFKRSLVVSFTQETDQLIRKLYLQSIKFYQRCSSISDTPITQKNIPKLPLEALVIIESIPILTSSTTSPLSSLQKQNSNPVFDISEHLSYSQTVSGLRIPLSFGPKLIFTQKHQQQRPSQIDYPARFLQQSNQQESLQNQQEITMSTNKQNSKSSSQQKPLAKPVPVYELYGKKQQEKQNDENDQYDYDDIGDDDDEEYLDPHSNQQIKEKDFVSQQQNQTASLNPFKAWSNQEKEEQRNPKIQDEKKSAERVFAEFGFTNLEASQSKEKKTKQKVDIDFFGHIDQQSKQLQNEQADSIWGALTPKESNQKNNEQKVFQINLLDDFDCDYPGKSENISALNNFDPSHPALIPNIDAQKSTESQRLPAKALPAIFDANQLNSSLQIYSMKSEKTPQVDCFENSEVPAQSNGEAFELALKKQISNGPLKVPKDLASYGFTNVKQQQIEQGDGRFRVRQRMDSENISDDEVQAHFPLASVVISIHSKSEQSPKTEDKYTKQEEDVINDGNENNQVQKILQFLPQQSTLIEYIRKQVSDEFLNFIVDAKTIQIGQRIGSGTEYTTLNHMCLIVLFLLLEYSKGNSCEVFRGVCRNTDVAVKVIKLDNSDDIHLKEFQREIAALIKLKNHPNLLQLIAISSSENNFYIVTQFCQGGTLFQLLHKRKQEITSIPWVLRISWLKDIANGMTFLHANSLIHRDLKSLNLLLDSEVDLRHLDRIPKMRIADFGLTRPGTNSNLLYHSGVLGTFHWMAPECMRNEAMSQKSDVYSFAIVIWEMCTRMTPYSEMKDITQIIKFVADCKGRPNVDIIPSDTPLELRVLMLDCWEEDPSMRPTFKEVVERLNQCEQY